MSQDLNRCEFIGRLVKDPELRHSANGIAICNVTLACGWKTKDKDGTEYVRVVAYQRLAEVIAEYMKKGSQMFVSGRQSTRKYEQDGQTKYSTEVIADFMQMLAHAKGSEAKEPVKIPPKAIAQIEDDIPF